MLCCFLQDASTASLVWVLTLMAEHPDVLERVRTEQAAARPDLDATITAETLTQMPYTRQVSQHERHALHRRWEKHPQRHFPQAAGSDKEIHQSSACWLRALPESMLILFAALILSCPALCPPSPLPQVIKEVLRYRPPAPMVPQVAMKPFKLTDNYTVS